MGSKRCHRCKRVQVNHVGDYCKPCDDNAHAVAMVGSFGLPDGVLAQVPATPSDYNSDRHKTFGYNNVLRWREWLYDNKQQDKRG